MRDLDIIIPVKNEADSIEELILRLGVSFKREKINYRIIFVDDHSEDNTVDVINKCIKRIDNGGIVYDIFGRNNFREIKLLFKKGKPGKAYSILEGSKFSDAKYLAYIDGDLQYPPEVLPKMYYLAKKTGICVAQRREGRKSVLRKIGSKINKFVFEKTLHGLDCDVQSGMKVFKKDIIKDLNTKDINEWTLDLPLILSAREKGYKIETVDIDFRERKNGESKVNFLKTSFQIAKVSISQKLKTEKIIPIQPSRGTKKSFLGAGVIYKGCKYITHNNLPFEYTALETFTFQQKLFITFIFLGLLAGLLTNAKFTIIFIIAILAFLYFTDFTFTLLVLLKSLRNPPEINIGKKELRLIRNNKLPIYSILCPLYKEVRVLPQFVEAIKNISWPKDRLDVLFLLEEDDKDTIEAARKLRLPRYFRIIIVPHSKPKTKPKACNFGLAKVRGEYVVVYDAEDKPDPNQLKKAYLAFQKISPEVACLQCKLNYYNTNQNLLTRIFSAEYSLWFDLILPGLQSIRTNIPLGGTSNHFKVSILRYLGGWDPFNVTEDCDLGARIFTNGFKTEIINSTTYEEANSRLKSWLKQRSRWIKGYLQTYLVHMRHPVEFFQKYGIHALIFQMVIGARMVFILINPILWLVTISYFAFRSSLGPTIESFYPTPIFYMALIPMIFGNFTYIYNYMIACGKRGKWELVKYIYLIPFYWLATTYAAFIAFYQLVTRPHYWEKTEHGFHLGRTQAPVEKPSISGVFTQPSLAYNFQENTIISKLSLGKFSQVFDFFNKFRNSFITLVWRVDIKPLNFSFLKPKNLKNILFREGTILVFATGIVNLVNFVFNAYLGRKVSLDDFGTIALASSFLTIYRIFSSALGRTITFKSAYLYGKHSFPIVNIWYNIKSWLMPLSLFITLVWLLLIPVTSNSFKTESVLPMLLFTPIISVSLMDSLNKGFLSGIHKFKLISILILAEAFVKLFLSIIFVEFHLENWLYLSLSAPLVFAYLISYYFVKKYPKINLKKFRDVSLPANFYFVSLLTSISNVIFISVDVLLAKYYLTPEDAGRFALLSLSGKIIYLLGSLFIQFINPIVSKKQGAGEISGKVLSKLFGLVFLPTLIGFLGVGWYGKYTLPILFGDKTLSIISYLPVYTLGIACFTLGYAVVSYYQSRNLFIFPIVGFLTSLFEVFYIVLFNKNIASISAAVGISGVLYFVNIMLLHFIYLYAKTIIRNFSDFLGILQPLESRNRANGKLRILIFNWRDTKHVWAGGAEVYIQEIAKRWVKNKNQVTIFCGNDGKNKRNEKIDGVNIIRRGGFYTVYFWAFIYYIFQFRGKFDIIIDCENAIPFFTPLYSNLPKILLVHHVHQSVVRKYLPFPLSSIAYLLESKLMPYLYKNCQKVTVSPSSKADMIKLGLGENIEIVNPGVNIGVYKPSVKTKNPSILYLGRLKAYKSIDTLIKAIPQVLKVFPNVQLNIAGFGESREDLEKLAKSLNLENSVKFLGKVSEKMKVKLMGQSWVFVYPSTMEGWGIAAVEANACGTPVIASNVPGLRDSIKNPHTGLFANVEDVKSFEVNILQILSDSDLRKRLSKNSIKWAKNFDWDKISDKFLQIVISEIAYSNNYSVENTAIDNREI